MLDSDRKPAASARVVVRHGSTGSEAQTLTDAGGRYQITGLRPGGPYTVRVTLLGHAPAERSGLESWGWARWWCRTFRWRRRPRCWNR